MRDSFVMYRSFVDALMELPAEEFKAAFTAISKYALDDEECQETGIIKAVYLMAKPQIDSNNRRYQNGKKGGRKPAEETETAEEETEEEPNRNQTVTKANQTATKPKPKPTEAEPNVYVYVNDNVNDNDSIRDAYASMSSAWNDIPGLTPIRGISGKRKELLSARIREFGEEGILQAIEKIKESSFLRGQNDRGWTITFDWFIKPSNFQKVLEGTYSDQARKVRTTENARSGTTRQYNWTELEASLIRAQRG